MPHTVTTLHPLTRCALFAGERRTSLAGADTLARVRIDPRGGSLQEMGDCFISSPLSMAPFSSTAGLGQSAATTPLSASAAAGGDAATPLSAFAIMPVDGNQAAYMPPASLPSSTARAVQAEPDDNGVRTLQRLE